MIFKIIIGRLGVSVEKNSKETLVVCTLELGADLLAVRDAG
jgi:hypothetical protein